MEVLKLALADAYGEHPVPLDEAPDEVRHTAPCLVEALLVGTVRLWYRPPMPTEAAVRAQLQAFLAEGSARELARQLGASWSRVKLGRIDKDTQRLDTAEVAQLAAALENPPGRKQDRRLDDPHRLAAAQVVQNARDPYYPFARERRYDFTTRVRSFYAANKVLGAAVDAQGRPPVADRDGAAELRHLVLPRVRAGLVRDVDSAGARACWVLGRLRLFRAQRVIAELSAAALCWATEE